MRHSKIAELCGVSGNTIVNWAKNQNMPKWAETKILVEKLDILVSTWDNKFTLIGIDKGTAFLASHIGSQSVYVTARSLSADKADITLNSLLKMDLVSLIHFSKTTTTITEEVINEYNKTRQCNVPD